MSEVPGMKPVIIISVAEDDSGTRTECHLFRPDPVFYGLLLGDAAHTVANAMIDAGLLKDGQPMDRGRILQTIGLVFQRELKRPTAKHREENPEERSVQ